MLDIGTKEITLREAIVAGKIMLNQKVIDTIDKKKMPKGDVLGAARLAGILAAKRTPDMIPLCHPIPIDYIGIECSLGRGEVRVEATVRGKAKTGVEMEAFTGVAVSLLTIYDMCKAHDRGAVISEIKLLKKSGGKSGAYERQ